MNNDPLVFETILIAITIVILMSSFSGDNIVMFLAWWFIFGFLQVIHAMLLGFTYHITPAIWRFLKWYYIGLFAEFLLIILKGSMEANSSSQVYLPYIIFVLWILPAMLAFYLWFITRHFRRTSAAENTG